MSLVYQFFLEHGVDVETKEQHFTMETSQKVINLWARGQWCRQSGEAADDREC